MRDGRKDNMTVVVAGLVLLLPLAACVRLTALPFRSHAVGIVRCAPRQRNAGRHPVTMVSERHNQAYKETHFLARAAEAGKPSQFIPLPSKAAGAWARHSGSVKVGPMNTRTGLTPTLPMLV